MEQIVIEKLKNDRWSPEQISERLKLERHERVSHESIYKFIYEERNSSGSLFKYLLQHGRRRKRVLVRRNRLWPKNEPRKFIEDRPNAENKRREQGHWERDLVMGKREEGGGLLTIVDRKSRYALVSKVGSKECAEVANTTLELFKANPGLPLETMTNDNGVEFGEYSKIEKQLDTPIYSTHPYCSWEKGTNENTNGLLREVFPKGSSIASVSNKHINEVTRLLNNRPRKILQYRTPHEVLHGVQGKLFRSDSYYRKKTRLKELRAS